MTDQGKPGVEVRLEGVSKRYGEVSAVKPLELMIEAGSLVTLLGPSGCGKTTLLRLIAGLEQASSGTIRIASKDVTLLSARERNVSMVFQSYALFPHMTVAENIAYGLRSEGRSRDAARGEVKRMLDLVGLAGLGERQPSELSGGQQQRVALARALVLEPHVLLFDEPLSNLDTRLRRQMRHEIRALQQRLGMTVVYVTHDQDEAMAVSDRIVVMRNGEIAASGAPRELFERPPSAFVAGFMGEANILDGVADGAGAVSIGPVRLDAIARGVPAGPVKVVVRPAALTLARPEDASAAPAIPGRIESSVYLGSHDEIVVESPAGRLLVFSSPDGRAKPNGTGVLVRLDPARCTIVAT